MFYFDLIGYLSSTYVHIIESFATATMKHCMLYNSRAFTFSFNYYLIWVFSMLPFGWVLKWSLRYLLTLQSSITIKKMWMAKDFGKSIVALTLFGTGGDTFIPCPFLDVSWIFFKNFQTFFGGENWHQSGYFDTMPSSLSLTKVGPWWF